MLLHYYELLDVPITASKSEIRRAFKDLLKVWHPDRFQDNPQLKVKAEAKTREIICAYEGILLKMVEAERLALKVQLADWETITPHFQSEVAINRSRRVESRSKRPAFVDDSDWSTSRVQQLSFWQWLVQIFMPHH